MKGIVKLVYSEHKPYIMGEASPTTTQAREVGERSNKWEGTTWQENGREENNILFLLNGVRFILFIIIIFLRFEMITEGQ